MSKHGSTQKLEEKQKRDVKNRSSEQVEDDDDENGMSTRLSTILRLNKTLFCLNQFLNKMKR